MTTGADYEMGCHRCKLRCPLKRTGDVEEMTRAWDFIDTHTSDENCYLVIFDPDHAPEPVLRPEEKAEAFARSARARGFL